MRRVVVVGCSGSGKTTVARRLAQSLDVPHVELDAFFNLYGWTDRASEEMRAIVDAETSRPGWVVDGNYLWLMDLTWRRADSVIFLDLARATVMRQLISRTLHRVILRTALWNGNRERLGRVLSRDPRRSIVLWAWKRHPQYRVRYNCLRQDPLWGELSFVHLPTRRDVKAFLRTQSAPVLQSAYNDLGYAELSER